MNSARPAFRGTLATLASCVLLCLVVTALAAAQRLQQAPCGTYQHVYPYNTEQLVEDHFIVLECRGEEPRGWYYGTSDDFDRGREGYLPGFFVAELEELTLSGDSIRFVIQVTDEDYVSEPVPLSYRVAEEVPPGRFERWRHRSGAGRRAYEGTISSDSIVLDVDGRRRSFRRLNPG